MEIILRGSVMKISQQYNKWYLPEADSVHISDVIPVPSSDSVDADVQHSGDHLHHLDP